MTTVAIIQARMGSTRLPGKVLADLRGMPVLAWSARAARAIVGVDEVVVATSTASADDRIAKWAAEANVSCFRGSESDVLDRFYAAASSAGADIVIRLTADCPFLDPTIASQTLVLLKRTGADFASNSDPASWPDGLDCEVVRFPALASAHRDASRASDREHVMPFIRNNRTRFRIESLVCPVPGLAGERWTLDTPEDLAFVTAVAEHLSSDRPPTMAEVLDVLERHPDYRALNAVDRRDAGWSLSISKEPLSTDRHYVGSQTLLARAERSIPLGTQTFSKSKTHFPHGASPSFITHGQGGRVWDVDGNEYVDLVGALLPNILGYRDPDVDDAIRRQLTQGISFSLATELEVTLAEQLVRLIPCAEMVRFGKNGTDATSAAIRLARAATGRDHILMCGYHGWQDWYIGATTRNRGVPAAVSALSHMVPYNDLDGLDAAFRRSPGEIAAVIMEPAGVAAPKDGYLAAVRDITHRNGALLIFDEIITGLRWAPGGAQQYYGITPDLAAFGKALGNGMPIAAIVGRAEIMRLMEEIFISSTFGGETLSLAAAIAVVAKIERAKVPERLWDMGGVLRREVETRITATGVGDCIGLIGSAPWMILAFKDHPGGSKEAIKTLFLREMIAAGVLINASHNLCYAHTSADLAHVLRAYDHALGILRDALDAEDIATRTGNQLIRPLFTVRSTQ
ncbi:MAG: aminotransferase class III-fold pyridoxal phosphate-dependent enzyme [Proteobacteria bacterium]|nr:aminotransferase class III-fold pyridoxal phosphate-dependent enzyme [Pseudomonadota bacterium]